jgi:FkbM family methyltransferase
MSKILKKLRLLPAINKPIAAILKATGLKAAQRYWPISGKYKLCFQGIEFYNELHADDLIANDLFYGNNWEAEELSLFLDYARKSKTILDVGANTGIYSVLSSKSNREAQIHCFEPNPYNFKRLQANLRLNEPNRITLNQVAVGNALAPVEFAVPTRDIISYTSSANIDFSKNTHTGEIEWKTVQVPQVTIDRYCSQRDIKPDLIKIDVEGFEQNVFRGALETMKQNRPVIVCEIFFDKESVHFYREHLALTNYKMYAIGGPRHMSELKSGQESMEGVSNNFLLIPSGQSITS